MLEPGAPREMGRLGVLEDGPLLILAVALGSNVCAVTVTLVIELATSTEYPVALLENAGWSVPGLTVNSERLDSGDGGATGAGAFDTSEQAPRPSAMRSEKKTVQIVCRLKKCVPIVEPR